jgi:hypothetical protein
MCQNILDSPYLTLRRPASFQLNVALYQLFGAAKPIVTVDRSFHERMLQVMKFRELLGLGLAVLCRIFINFVWGNYCFVLRCLRSSGT